MIHSQYGASIFGFGGIAHHGHKVGAVRSVRSEVRVS